jgi:hypothetical protein
MITCKADKLPDLHRQHAFTTIYHMEKKLNYHNILLGSVVIIFFLNVKFS